MKSFHITARGEVFPFSRRNDRLHSLFIHLSFRHLAVASPSWLREHRGTTSLQVSVIPLDVELLDHTVVLLGAAVRLSVGPAPSYKGSLFSTSPHLPTSSPRQATLVGTGEHLTALSTRLSLTTSDAERRPSCLSAIWTSSSETRLSEPFATSSPGYVGVLLLLFSGRSSWSTLDISSSPRL